MARKRHTFRRPSNRVEKSMAMAEALATHGNELPAHTTHEVLHFSES